MEEPLIFELSQPGRRAVTFPPLDVPTPPWSQMITSTLQRHQPPALPSVSEIDVVRHFTRLSQRNFSIDTHFYPLGSCTMKYNPKVSKMLISRTNYRTLHPWQPPVTCQGMLWVFAHMEELLADICGMDAFTLQPVAGAHGELTGILLAHAYHRARGRSPHKVLIPDSAHGTNPASAALGGFSVVSIPSDRRGRIDVEALKQVLDEDTALVMLTNPNTLGLFEDRVQEIAELTHRAGALLYMDGANLNALVGLTRPGDLGFDILHVNLHKTFATPHGGGGPGAGPVGVKRAIEPFLPVPRLKTQGDQLVWSEDYPQSIGKVRAFHGNALTILRAYIYLRALGREGLRTVSQRAILNANYLRVRLKPFYHLPYDEPCLHECIFSAVKQKAQGVKALDIAKRLLDLGFHPPTIYFPLIVEEALMIEPVETESKQVLDAFVNAMIAIAKEAETHPERLREAPTTTPVRRLDEVKAAREPNLRYRPPVPQQSQRANPESRNMKVL
ncbi:MAG: aminomethyl-transferring glycine dehydrogenase subunit GcvPB [Elusimicrobia bacterium]|nr:aminomethyl-transferring glycine dehydrogenase subunit GcvPB [Elusimicrobiota bacterium]